MSSTAVDVRAISTTARAMAEAKLAAPGWPSSRKMAELRTWEITLNELLDNYRKVIEKGKTGGGYKWLIWERSSFTEGISELRDRLIR